MLLTIVAERANDRDDIISLGYMSNSSGPNFENLLWQDHQTYRPRYMQHGRQPTQQSRKLQRQGIEDPTQES